MWHRLMVLLAVAALWSAASAQEAAQTADKDDPIGAELKKSIDAYEAAIVKAQKKLLGAFDDKEKELSEKPGMKAEERLTLIQQLRTERKAFEAEQKAPKSVIMQRSAAEYELEMASARKTLGAAYEKAADAYLKKGDVANATKMVEDKKKILQVRPASTSTTPAKPTQLTHLLRFGSIWVGTFQWKSGENKRGLQNAMLVVIDRTGDRFVAIRRWDYGPVGSPEGKGLEEVQGMVKGNELECGKDVKYYGIFRDGKIELKAISVNGSKGEGLLKLVK